MSPSSVVDYAVAIAATSVRAVFYHSIASLALLVWNCFVTFDDEVQYIWTCVTGLILMQARFPTPRFINTYKAHNSLIGTLADGSNPPRLCDIRFFYVATSSQAFESSLEFILASRGKSKMISPLEDAVRLDKVCSVCSIQPIQKGCNPAVVFDFNGGWRDSENDMVAEKPPTFMEHVFYYDRLAITAIKRFTVHFMLISMTLFKYFLARKAGWGRTPLISLVVRDGSTVYATMLFWLISAAIMLGMENKEAIALCFWISAFISISGCRMILSMERFARRANSVESPPNQPFLTSQFNLWTLDFGRALGNHQLDHNVTLPLT
ncbi:hypothetical protein HD554DRAFT_2299719 [Boletus coccyginus]|nr:hypothetical protein HD554DRAFT_2299719 [Boletus coccyginus]